MKKFFLLCIFSSFASFLFSQALFTYGSQAVSKEEFLRAYNKNNTAVTDKNAALREYLDLYIKFKLKVKAAHDLHLDTLPNINADLQNFRSQIEESYLNDDKEVNNLVDEAFTRSQKDIHIMHLFIAADKVATDTSKTLQAAQEAYNALLKNMSFEDASEALKKRAVTSSFNDLGFVTVFSIPYEFENIVYQLKPGEISKPYHSKSGYHIFKNLEERSAAGKMKMAQILIALPPGADEQQRLKTSLVADSIYKSLHTGADFSEMAKAVSNDQNTYMSGGVMPEFGTGKYDPVFEGKAISLQKDNDISEPFQTSFGYHILKRLGRTPVPSGKNDAEYMAALKQQVLQDSRMSSAKEKFLKDVLKKLGYKQNIALNDNTLWNITDSFIVNNKKIAAGNLTDKTILFSFDNNKMTVADWLKFSRDFKNDVSLNKGESYQQIMQKFIADAAIKDYRKRLELFNPEFKYQLQEFKDGNMLFEIMERKVWSKASNDTVALLNFFNQNKTKYYWKESADVVLVSCANEKAAVLAAQKLQATNNWHALTEDNSLQVQTDSGRYELYQMPVKPNSTLTPGIITEPLVNAADSTASFVKIIKVYPAHQPRTFEDARGLVINDYQNFLEEKWIQQLKKKYPVKINENVFKALIN